MTLSAETARDERLYGILQASKEAELTASGKHRREAFRTTRKLLGAAHQLGYTTASLGVMMGVTGGSISGRIQPPERIDVAAFVALVPENGNDQLSRLVDASDTADTTELLAQYLASTTRE